MSGAAVTGSDADAGSPGKAAAASTSAIRARVSGELDRLQGTSSALALGVLTEEPFDGRVKPEDMLGPTAAQ